MPPSVSSNSFKAQSGLRSPTSPGLGFSLGKSTSRTSHTESPVKGGTSPRYDPTGKEAEFDRMLMSETKTKRVQLSKGKEEATIWHKSIDPPLEPLKSMASPPRTREPTSPRVSGHGSGSTLTPPVPSSTFKVVSRDRAQSVGQHNRSNQASEEEDEIRTPEMSRDETFTTPIVVGRSPTAIPTLAAPIQLEQSHAQAHAALRQLSSSSHDAYAHAQPSKPLPTAPAPLAPTPPRKIQPPLPTEREIRARSESGSDRAEVLAPSPRPPSRDSAGMLEAGVQAGQYGSARSSGYAHQSRDTIHGIVEDYGHSRPQTEAEEDEEDEQDEGEEGYDYDEEEEETAHEHQLRLLAEEERERIRFRPVSDIEGDDGEFRPPGPLFDVAPTREPSPGRYQHGLPLHHGMSVSFVSSPPWEGEGPGEATEMSEGWT